MGTSPAGLREGLVFLGLVLSSRWAYLTRKSGFSGCCRILVRLRPLEPLGPISVLTVSVLHFELSFQRVRWA